MKLMKVFGIVSILVMIVSLSSCVKNGEGDDWDKKWEEWMQDVRTEIKASYGSYEGKLYTMSNEPVKDDEEVKKDEMDATWMLNNDSTIDLYDVPAALLVKQLPESQKALKEAVSNAGNVKIHVQLRYDYYYHSPLVMYARLLSTCSPSICTWTTSFRQNLLLHPSSSGLVLRRHFSNTASYNSAMNRAV